MKEAEKNKTSNNQGPVFAIQRIYTKDVSFETPNSPAIFLEQWKPEMSLDLKTKADKLGDGFFDVTLTITVTVKSNTKTAFLVEIHQAGIFQVKGFEEETLKSTLAVFCPTILYPYARQMIDDLVTKGGFPPLYLQHVSFEALCQKQLEDEKKAKN